MRALLTLIFGVCVTGFCGLSGPEEFHPFEGPAPLLVFIETTNPWATLSGTDMPRVAIYENGEFIFAKQSEHGLLYRHFTLDAERLARLKEFLEPVLALKDLQLRYDVMPRGVAALHQSESQFYLHVGDRELATTVSGLTAPGAKPVPRTASSGEVNPDFPPAALLLLHSWLCAFDAPEATEWSPRYLEVMFREDSNASDASIAWPKEWPSLHSERALKRDDHDSIFLDDSMEPQLRAFLETRKASGAIEIDGKKMEVTYRLTFPGEPVWRNAITYGTNPPVTAQDKADH